jgi:hypothetical protein
MGSPPLVKIYALGTVGKNNDAIGLQKKKGLASHLATLWALPS